MNLAQEFFDTIGKASVEEVKNLLKKDSSLASSKNQAGVSAIMMALYCGRRELADLFLSTGAQPSVFEAAALGNTQTLASLLEKDPRAVNSASADGFSPLHLACFMGQVETAKLLIEKGADLNAASTNGADLKPINSAAACRDLEAATRIVNSLLGAGASAAAKQKGGYSALHSAAANGNLPLVKLLIEAGADTSTLSDDKKTPLQFAQERNRTDVVTFLSK